MKAILLILILTGLLQSTSGQNTDREYARLIKGDWTGLSDDSVNERTGLTFSFEDSVCSFPYPFYDFEKYNIEKNMIIVKPDPDYSKEKILKFSIVQLKNDSLVLRSINPDSKITETIRLRKIKPKNDLVFTALYFESSPCFGVCPSMVIKIDSSKNFFFYSRRGRFINKMEGQNTGIISSENYLALINKIRNLPATSILPSYSANWTDDQSCKISIITTSGKISSNVYGYDKEPIELRILFNYLMHLYIHTNLSKSKFVMEEDFKKDLGFDKNF